MHAPPRPSFTSRKAVLLFALLSALYFTDTLLRASLKAFWYDELLTVYLCRLPSFHATWTAVVHGCDFNPPLFYVLTRVSERLLGGEGLIASRLPAILGFWLFSICLYVFTSRRLGRVFGCIAALTPVFTIASYYAFEARAYGLALAWCGMMLVCWQRTREREPSKSQWTDPWLFGLTFSFLAALLSHAYAVFFIIPFLSAEAYAFFTNSRFRWATVAVLLVPIPFVVPMYLSMLHNLNSFRLEYGHDHPQIRFQHYLVFTFGPVLLLLLITMAVVVWQSGPEQQDEVPANLARFSKDELVLAFAFLVLPVIGIIVARVTQGAYNDRYFLGATAGFALLYAQLISATRQRNRIAMSCMAAMLLLFAGDTLLAVRGVRGADLVQIEPASQFTFNATPSRPLQRDVALISDPSGLDVLVTEEHNYFYLFYYAPEKLRRRITFGSSNASDFPLATYRLLNRWAGAQFQTATYAEFFSRHKEFLVYGSNNGHFNGGCQDCIDEFLKAGYTLRSVRRDEDSLLEHFSR